MKTITLLAAVALMANAANATEVIKDSGAEKRIETKIRFDFDEPIAFMERGIEFFVFPNGEFDFNTEASTGSGTYFRTEGRKMNTTSGAPGNANGGVRIEHDAQGRVRRIGNVFVNYDSANRIKRIGTVYMTYNRTALTQIGGMRIVYDRRGRIVDMIGNVKGSQAYAYQDAHNSHNTGGSYNDNDYYYYKTDGTKAKIEEKATEK
ncbi:MAG TPA: hypothetical protein VK623_09230 [Flavobacterium sp.]|nr:hypothetical protein [Flavobacterium sp.]